MTFNTKQVVDETDVITVTGSVTDASATVDNTVLYTGSITAIGAGAAIEMAGYSNLSIQLSGTWVGNIQFESSHDGTTWDMVLIHSRDDVALQDMVDQNGMYTVRASGKYLRYNVTNLTGTIVAVMLGKTTDPLSPADKLSFAMDKQLNMPIYVEAMTSEKRDVLGAQIPSDAPAPINWTSYSVTNCPLVIDTTGYQSVIVHKRTAGIITPSVSNDGITYYGTYAYLSSSQALGVTLPAALGIYSIPVTAKFLKLTGPATTVNCVVYLRAFPAMILSSTSLSNIAGSAIISGGTAGTLGVGGAVASGVAPTTNPLVVGGVDEGRKNYPGMLAANLVPMTRTARIDEKGRFILANVDPQLPPSFLGQPPALTKDVSQHEGQSLIEVMALILAELRTLNHQIHEMPIALNGIPWVATDELNDIRAEQLNFGSNH